MATQNFETPEEEVINTGETITIIDISKSTITYLSKRWNFYCAAIQSSQDSDATERLVNFMFDTLGTHVSAKDFAAHVVFSFEDSTLNVSSLQPGQEHHVAIHRYDSCNEEDTFSLFIEESAE